MEAIAVSACAYIVSSEFALLLGSSGALAIAETGATCAASSGLSSTLCAAALKVRAYVAPPVSEIELMDMSIGGTCQEEVGQFHPLAELGRRLADVELSELDNGRYV